MPTSWASLCVLLALLPFTQRAHAAGNSQHALRLAVPVPRHGDAPRQGWLEADALTSAATPTRCWVDVPSSSTLNDSLADSLPRLTCAGQQLRLTLPVQPSPSSHAQRAPDALPPAAAESSLPLTRTNDFTLLPIVVCAFPTWFVRMIRDVASQSDVQHAQQTTASNATRGALILTLEGMALATLADVAPINASYTLLHQRLCGMVHVLRSHELLMQRVQCWDLHARVPLEQQGGTTLDQNASLSEEPMTCAPVPSDTATRDTWARALQLERAGERRDAHWPHAPAAAVQLASNETTSNAVCDQLLVLSGCRELPDSRMAVHNCTLSEQAAVLCAASSAQPERALRHAPRECSAGRACTAHALLRHPRARALAFFAHEETPSHARVRAAADAAAPVRGLQAALSLTWETPPSFFMLPTNPSLASRNTVSAAQLPSLSVRASGSAVAAGAYLMCTASAQGTTSSMVPIAFVGSTRAGSDSDVVTFSSLGITGDPSSGAEVLVTIACNASATLSTPPASASISEYGGIAFLRTHLAPSTYSFPPSTLEIWQLLEPIEFQIRMYCVSNKAGCTSHPAIGYPISTTQVSSTELMFDFYLEQPSSPTYSLWINLWTAYFVGGTFSSNNDGTVSSYGVRLANVNPAGFYDSNGILQTPMELRFYAATYFRGAPLQMIWVVIPMRNLTLQWTEPPPVAIVANPMVMLANQVDARLLSGSIPDMTAQVFETPLYVPGALPHPASTLLAAHLYRCMVEVTGMITLPTDGNVFPNGDGVYQFTFWYKALNGSLHTSFRGSADLFMTAPPGVQLSLALSCTIPGIMLPSLYVRGVTRTAYLQPLLEHALLMSPSTGQPLLVDFGLHDLPVYSARTWLQTRHFERVNMSEPAAWLRTATAAFTRVTRVTVAEYVEREGTSIALMPGYVHPLASRMLIFVPRTLTDSLDEYVPLWFEGEWNDFGTGELRCDAQFFSNTSTTSAELANFHHVLWPAQRNSMSAAAAALNTSWQVQHPYAVPTTSVGANASLTLTLRSPAQNISVDSTFMLRVACARVTHFSQLPAVSASAQHATWFLRSQPLLVRSPAVTISRAANAGMLVLRPTVANIAGVGDVAVNLSLAAAPQGSIAFPVQMTCALRLLHAASAYRGSTTALDVAVQLVEAVASTSTGTLVTRWALEQPAPGATLLASLEGRVTLQRPNVVDIEEAFTLPLLVNFTVTDYRLTLSAYENVRAAALHLPADTVAAALSWLMLQANDAPTGASAAGNMTRLQAVRHTPIMTLTVSTISRVRLTHTLSMLDPSAASSEVRPLPGVWPQVALPAPLIMQLQLPTHSCRAVWQPLNDGAALPATVVLRFNGSTVSAEDVSALNNTARSTLLLLECLYITHPIAYAPAVRVSYEPVALSTARALPAFVTGGRPASSGAPDPFHLEAHFVNAGTAARVYNARPGIRCSVAAERVAATENVTASDDTITDDVSASGTVDAAYDTSSNSVTFSSVVLSAPPSTDIKLVVSCYEESVGSLRPFLRQVVGSTRTYGVLVLFDSHRDLAQRFVGERAAMPARLVAAQHEAHVMSVAYNSRTRVSARLLSQNGTGHFDAYNYTLMGSAVCTVLANGTLTGQASDLQASISDANALFATLTFHVNIVAEPGTLVALTVSCVRRGFETLSVLPLLVRVTPVHVAWKHSPPLAVALPSTLLALQALHPPPMLRLFPQQALDAGAAMPMEGAACSAQAWVLPPPRLAASWQTGNTNGATMLAAVDGWNTSERTAACATSEAAGDDSAPTNTSALPDSVTLAVVRRGSLLASPLANEWNATLDAVVATSLHVTAAWNSFVCIKFTCHRAQGDAAATPLYHLLRIPQIAMRWRGQPPARLSAGSATLLPFSIELYDAAAQNGLPAASRAPVLATDAPFVCQAFMQPRRSAVNASLSDVLIVSGSVARVDAGVAEFPYFSLVLGSLFTAFELRVSCALGDQALDNALTWHLYSEGCPAGWRPSADWRACEECPPGMWSDANAAHCLPCPALGVTCVGGIMRLLPGFFFVPGTLAPDFQDPVVDVTTLAPANALAATDSPRRRLDGLEFNTSAPSIRLLLRAQAFELHACPIPDVCLVNATTGSYTCATGYTGALCNSCDQARGYVQADAQCVQCSTSAVNGVVFALILAALLLLLLYASRTGNVQRSRASITWRIMITYVSTLAAISRFSTAQSSAFSAFATIAQTALIPFTAGSTSAAVAPLQCTLHLSFYGRFYLSLLLPLIAVAAYVVFDPGLKSLWVRIRTRSAAAAAAVAAMFWHTYKLLAVLLLVTFMAYPSIIDAAVRALDCGAQPVGGIKYLRVDSSVACGTAEHRIASALAVATIAIACVVVPVGLCAWFAWNAHVIRTDAVLVAGKIPQPARPTEAAPPPAAPHAVLTVARSQFAPTTQGAAAPSSVTATRGAAGLVNARVHRMSRLSLSRMHALRDSNISQPSGAPSPFFMAFGFLFAGLRTDSILAVTWEAIIMVRRASIVLISLAPTWLDQIVWSLVVLLLSIVAHVTVLPYAQPLFNRLELATLVVLCVGQCMLALASCSTPLSLVASINAREGSCAVSPGTALSLLLVLHVGMLLVLVTVFGWLRWQEWQQQKTVVLQRVNRLLNTSARTLRAASSRNRRMLHTDGAAPANTLAHVHAARSADSLGVLAQSAGGGRADIPRFASNPLLRAATVHSPWTAASGHAPAAARAMLPSPSVGESPLFGVSEQQRRRMAVAESTTAALPSAAESRARILRPSIRVRVDPQHGAWAPALIQQTSTRTMPPP